MAQRKAADRRTTGRVTAKRSAAGPVAPKVDAGVASGRYTPPIPKEQKVSPRWVPILMFTLLTIGVLVIVLNYLDLLPGETSNAYLLIGLGFITGGFITATQYH